MVRVLKCLFFINIFVFNKIDNFIIINLYNEKISERHVKQTF